MFYKINKNTNDEYLGNLSALERPECCVELGDWIIYRHRQAPQSWQSCRLELDDPFVFSNRATLGHSRPVLVGGIPVGDGHFQCMAGPCSVESKLQLNSIADTLVTSGTHFLRGGAFKPRTSPYSFQGLGREGLRLMREVADRFSLKVVSEVMEASDISMVAEYVDILQVGSRNMHNAALLKAVGKVDKPVLLKRGFSATYEEFLLAAEYILSGGNPDVILCERGIRSFQDKTRNVLDLAGVALLKRMTHLPVLVDPSHATGLSELVPDMSLAALVAGADGLLVEIHPDPSRSISDKDQALELSIFQDLVYQLGRYAELKSLKLNPSCISK